jgi:hypothetical protein
MPEFDRGQIGVAFDMQGCPNRCRHCWLGMADNRTLTKEDVRWGVAKFREFTGMMDPPIGRLVVHAWFREPDYGDDYRELHDLATELSDGEPDRYELLIVWRLARDKAYADWAKSVGPDTCQISFAGMKEATDWFYRRRGAFDDALLATDRLLDAGMKPRWQLFLTTKLLPDLDQLLALVDRMELRRRVAALGSEFAIFMHTPSPDYEGRKIQDLRPTIDQVEDLPEAILAPTRNHFGRDTLWHSEAELYADILRDEDVADSGQGSYPLWFYVCSNWDVFSNVGTLEPWWRLGNLKEDTVESIVSGFQSDRALGLETLTHTSPRWLTEQYGRPESRKVYEYAADLVNLYRSEHCERTWIERQRAGYT